jgi:hypothetical protein
MNSSANLKATLESRALQPSTRVILGERRKAKKCAKLIVVVFVGVLMESVIFFFHALYLFECFPSIIIETIKSRKVSNSTIFFINLFKLYLYFVRIKKPRKNLV